MQKQKCYNKSICTSNKNELKRCLSKTQGSKFYKFIYFSDSNKITPILSNIYDKVKTKMLIKIKLTIKLNPMG